MTTYLHVRHEKSLISKTFIQDHDEQMMEIGCNKQAKTVCIRKVFRGEQTLKGEMI